MLNASAELGLARRRATAGPWRKRSPLATRDWRPGEQPARGTPSAGRPSRHRFRAVAIGSISLVRHRDWQGRSRHISASRRSPVKSGSRWRVTKDLGGAARGQESTSPKQEMRRCGHAAKRRSGLPARESALPPQKAAQCPPRHGRAPIVSRAASAPRCVPEERCERGGARCARCRDGSPGRTPRNAPGAAAAAITSLVLTASVRMLARRFAARRRERGNCATVAATRGGSAELERPSRHGTERSDYACRRSSRLALPRPIATTVPTRHAAFNAGERAAEATHTTACAPGGARAHGGPARSGASALARHPEARSPTQADE